MRLFLAIELPEEARQHLESLRKALEGSEASTRSIAWVKRQNWHITLKFLGEVNDSQVVQITAMLAKVPVEPMQLFAERMAYLPRRGPVRVVGVEVGGELDRLKLVHRAVETVCERCGFLREAREYLPHITIGRSRKGERDTGWWRLRDCKMENRFPGPAFIAKRFALMQSQLRAEGSEYHVVAQFPR